VPRRWHRPATHCHTPSPGRRRTHRLRPAASTPHARPLRRVALLWFAVDALTHLTVEASYVYVTAAHGGAEGSPSLLAYLWREYGRADRRWALYDPTVLALELLTVGIGGPLAAACAYGVYARRPWRHLAVVVLCVAELYGGWMTFAPEWLAGSPALSGDPYLQVVYLFYLNALWVLVPLVLLYDRCGVGRGSGTGDSAAGNGSPLSQGPGTALAPGECTATPFCVLRPSLPPSARRTVASSWCGRATRPKRRRATSRARVPAGSGSAPPPSSSTARSCRRSSSPARREARAPRFRPLPPGRRGHTFISSCFGALKPSPGSATRGATRRHGLSPVSVSRRPARSPSERS
jgi:hypothetical protein